MVRFCLPVSDGPYLKQYTVGLSQPPAAAFKSLSLSLSTIVLLHTVYVYYCSMMHDSHVFIGGTDCSTAYKESGTECCRLNLEVNVEVVHSTEDSTLLSTVSVYSSSLASRHAMPCYALSRYIALRGE